MRKPSADERADASRLVTFRSHCLYRRTTLPGRGRLARASAQTQNALRILRPMALDCNVLLETRLRKKLRHGDIQCRGNSEEIHYRNVVLSPLNATQITTIQSRMQR